MGTSEKSVCVAVAAAAAPAFVVNKVSLDFSLECAEENKNSCLTQ